MLGLHVISSAIEENLNARRLLCREPELFTHAVETSFIEKLTLRT
jgi:hypothetical protein